MRSAQATGRVWDAAIVGGGPAGSSAAIVLARRGWRTLVIERSDLSEPRIGETLPPTARISLNALGLLHCLNDDGHLRSPGTVAVWGSEEPYANDFIFDQDGDGWHLDRASFDARLMRTASESGATCLVRHAVRGCARTRTGAWALELIGPDGSVRIEANRLIDAAGRSPWPGRPFRRRRFDRLTALIAWLSPRSGLGLAPFQGDLRSWTEAVPNGWWYTSPIPGNRAIAAYFTDADLVKAPSKSRRERWSELLSASRYTRKRLDGLKVEGSFQVASASSGLGQPAARDWLAVGDAACSLDPLSSQGIAWALSTGIEAAETLMDPDFASAGSRYAAGLKERYRDYWRSRHWFYSSERRWPDSPFWRRRREADRLLSGEVV